MFISHVHLEATGFTILEFYVTAVGSIPIPIDTQVRMVINGDAAKDTHLHRNGDITSTIFHYYCYSVKVCLYGRTGKRLAPVSITV